MKKTITLILLIISYTNAYPQCNPYFNIEAGDKWTFENFDAKDKPTGRNELSVKSYSATSDGFVAQLRSVMYDKKGKELFNGELEYICENGVVYVDMKRYVSNQQLEAFGAYEIQMESENLEIPSDLEPNLELNDGTITIKASNSPIAMTMDVTITDRIVESEEEITVPAGTFNSFKINSNTNTRIKMAMSISKQYKSIQWYAKDVGMVRSESYDERGRLTGYSVLVEKK